MFNMFKGQINAHRIFFLYMNDNGIAITSYCYDEGPRSRITRRVGGSVDNGCFTDRKAIPLNKI